MGKSNEYVFNDYLMLLSGVRNPSSVAFLGFTGKDEFTDRISGHHEFYDLQLGNWDINSDWSLSGTYDLIICTRCPYFAKNPVDFISRCKKYLNVGGSLLIDYGLGDHWRFNNYKVGWVRNGEHEFAYHANNYLYSCMWKDEFESNEQVKQFTDAVKGRFDYPQDLKLSNVIREEVPVVFETDYKKIHFRYLWPDQPQLYIMLLI